MQWFKRDSEIEVLGASGMLRVTVKPKAHPLLFVLQAGGLVVFIYSGWGRWPALLREQPLYWILFSIAIVSSVGFQFSGSEEIEFDGQRRILVIRRNTWGWPGTREYSLDTLSGLEQRDIEDHNNADGLRCKAGTRTITFGKGVNSEQADRIFAELQSALPQDAHRLLAGNDPFDQHFTTLKLN